MCQVFNILKYPSCASIHKDCCPKFATGLKCLNRHRSKGIWVTSLFFCQNDSLMGESLWQKDSFVTLLLCELCLFLYLAKSQILGNSLYELRTMGHMCKWKPFYGLFATHSLTYSNFHNIKVTWDWVILGLTFYTVIMVPFNLAVYRTGYTSTGDITFLGKLHL